MRLKLSSKLLEVDIEAESIGEMLDMLGDPPPPMLVR